MNRSILCVLSIDFCAVHIWKELFDLLFDVYFNKGVEREGTRRVYEEDNAHLKLGARA